jgi:hypothetical protein
MTTTERQTIANTILSQLGGNRFKVMTGAKNFSFDANGNLAFRFPQHNKVNYCKVSLNPMDLYDVEFGMIRNKKGVPTYNKKVNKTNIYNESLQEVFTAQTGLYTTL